MAEATGDLIGNEIADAVQSKTLKTLLQNNSKWTWFRNT